MLRRVLGRKVSKEHGLLELKVVLSSFLERIRIWIRIGIKALNMSAG